MSDPFKRLTGLLSGLIAAVAASGTTDLTAVNAQLAELEADDVADDAAFADLNTRVANLEAGASTMQSSIDSFNQNINAVGTVINALTPRVDALEVGIAGLADAVAPDAASTEA